MIRLLIFILLSTILLTGCGLFDTASAVSLLQQKQELRELVEGIQREARMNKLEQILGNVEYDNFKNSLIQAAGDAYLRNNPPK